MRYFELRNLQDVALFLFPALVFVILFGMGLAFTHFIRKDSEKRHKEIIERFAGGIEGKNAPFPLVVYLIKSSCPCRRVSVSSGYAGPWIAAIDGMMSGI